VTRFGLTDTQAEGVLSMTLRRLTGLEASKLKEEQGMLLATIADLQVRLLCVRGGSGQPSVCSWRRFTTAGLQGCLRVLSQYWLTQQAVTVLADSAGCHSTG
jgi:hypothetical protein